MRRLISALIVLALAVLSLPGCGGSAEPTSSDAITLQLNWYPEAEHGGFYAALVHGYYEEAGLNVSIKPGGPGTKVVALVATNKATFGVANADKILTGCAQEADVVPLMAPIQDSPRCIIVHEESGIESLADLKNVTLAMSAGQPFAQFLRTKSDLAGVQVVPFNGGVTTFMQGPKFSQQAYSFSEPFTAKPLGANPRALMVSETGFNPYTSVLLAERGTVDASSEIVAKFVAASVKGWEKYLEDPKQTNEYIHSINPEMPMDVLEFGVEALRELCRADEVSVGSMTHKRWQDLTSQLTEIGVLKPGEIDITRVLEKSGAKE